MLHESRNTYLLQGTGLCSDSQRTQRSLVIGLPSFWETREDVKQTTSLNDAKNVLLHQHTEKEVFAKDD